MSASQYDVNNPNLITKLIPEHYLEMASQSDVFGLLKFLISNESNYITGQNIFVDGGFSIW